MTKIALTGLSAGNLNTLSMIKGISRQVVRPVGTGRFTFKSSIEHPTPTTLNLAFYFEQTAYVHSRFSLNQTPPIQKRNIMLSIDLEKGTAKGSDYLWLMNPAPGIRSDETLEIPGFNLLCQKCHKGKNPNEMRTPHNPKEGVLDILGLIFDNIISLVEAPKYDKADFLSEVGGVSSKKWPDEVTNDFSITLAEGAKATPESIYQTMVTLKNVLMSSPS